MLRLWRERLTAGVFPEGAWLHRAGGTPVTHFSGMSPAAYGTRESLERLLEDRTWRRRPNVDLLVSDSIARIAHLPWQASITNEAQCHGYARACFEQNGFELDEHWLLHAEFRHFGGIGIAYALPRALVTDLKDCLEARGLQLRSVLPVSAAAYWRNVTGALGQSRVLLLEDHRRVTALLFKGRACMGIHIQPCGSARIDAVRRLLTTVDTVLPHITRIQLWSPDEDNAIPIEVIQAQLPDTQVEKLTVGQWN